MKIIGELAWPVVVLVCVFLLRHQLGRLLIRLTHLRAPGVEADFAEQAAVTSDLAEAAVPDAPSELNADLRPLAEHPSLADLRTESSAHPVGAIVRAWGLIEQAGRGYLRIHAPGLSVSRVTPLEVFQRLRSAGVISDELLGVSERLWRLRTGVVHEAAVPTTAAAYDFVEAAWRLYTVIVEASLAELSEPLP